MLLIDNLMKPKLNIEWHQAHRMAQNASLEQGIAWHLEHSKNCSCRPIPERLEGELKKHGIKIDCEQ
jgi:hypothetical protein